MRLSLFVATTCVAFGLVGCGNAESIDPSEIDAENARREEARAAEVANASRAPDADAQVGVSAPAAQAVTTDAAPEGGQSPDTGANVTPPDIE